METARVDPHIKVLDETVCRLAIERGIDALVYAPHFTPWPTVVERAMRYSSDELFVVPARELFTGPWHDRKHVLCMDLAHPIPDFIGLDESLRVLAEQDACVVAPHPGYLSMSLSPADIRRYRDVFHAVEVYNPKYLPWHVPRARRLASGVDLPTISSSYAHLRSSVGTVWIEIEGPIRGHADVVDAIRAGEIVCHGHVTRGRLTMTKFGELGHLSWENTGQKLRRTLRGAPPATHPTNELYEGRFG